MSEKNSKNNYRFIKLYTVKGLEIKSFDLGLSRPMSTNFIVSDSSIQLVFRESMTNWETISASKSVTINLKDYSIETASFGSGLFPIELVQSKHNTFLLSGTIDPMTDEHNYQIQNIASPDNVLRKLPSDCCFTWPITQTNRGEKYLVGIYTPFPEVEDEYIYVELMDSIMEKVFTKKLKINDRYLGYELVNTKLPPNQESVFISATEIYEEQEYFIEVGFDNTMKRKFKKGDGYSLDNLIIELTREDGKILVRRSYWNK